MLCGSRLPREAEKLKNHAENYHNMEVERFIRIQSVFANPSTSKEDNEIPFCIGEDGSGVVGADSAGNDSGAIECGSSRTSSDSGAGNRADKAVDRSADADRDADVLGDTDRNKSSSSNSIVNIIESTSTPEVEGSSDLVESKSMCSCIIPMQDVDGCTYSCPKCIDCNTSFASLAAITLHVQREHVGNLAALICLRKSRVKVSKTECKVCGETVVQDRVELGHHVWTAHGLPLEAYAFL